MAGCKKESGQKRISFHTSTTKPIERSNLKSNFNATINTAIGNVIILRIIHAAFMKNSRWEKLSLKYSTNRNNQTNIPFKGNRTEKINFSYLGSIFSQLADKEITEVFKKVIRYFRSIHSFDLLSPYYLKQRSKSTSGSIGFAGEDLAPFLFDLNDELRSKVIGKIKTVYPEFNSFSSSQHADGTKQITITEQYRDGNIQYAVPARIANDGIMRIIAIIAQLNAKTDFLLFDEIENGINQELVDFLLKQLVNAEQQIVVTTHSPLFMNYLNDELAKESVTYFYKTPEGYTRCIPFFEIPSILEKLEVMGPGEAFADTDLFGLAREIERITSSSEKEE
jgi:hypothetical protein